VATNAGDTLLFSAGIGIECPDEHSKQKTAAARILGFRAALTRIVPGDCLGQQKRKTVRGLRLFPEWGLPHRGFHSAKSKSTVAKASLFQTVDCNNPLSSVLVLRSPNGVSGAQAKRSGCCAKRRSG
jgi:hypothetical protein